MMYSVMNVLCVLTMFILVAPPPVKAIVKFSWSGSKDNHLSLKRGAIVSVYQQSEKWWSGELDGKVGWFPKTFVKIIDEQENQHQETM